MNNYLKLLVFMTLGLFNWACSAQAPKGNLIYCSYSKSGSAGLGKEYCELIADKDSASKVVVAKNLHNRFGNPEIRCDYPVDAENVEELKKALQELGIYKYNGYNLEEPITGGYAYRLYMEYDSGEKINIRWYGHGVKDTIQSAYNYVYRFFAPWRSQAK